MRIKEHETRLTLHERDDDDDDDDDGIKCSSVIHNLGVITFHYIYAYASES